MLTTDIITLAQKMLQDTGAVRWSSADLSSYLTGAEQRAFELRPDLWFNASGVLGAISASTGSITPSIRDALAHYVCFMALSEDDSDRGNAQNAAGHLVMFNQLLRGA